MQAQSSIRHSFINSIVHGDCIEIMRQMSANSVDFILTDPPYRVNFHDRQGRRLQNDVDANWLRPAMAEAFRVLKHNRLMLCFYGWPRAEKFLEAWRELVSGLWVTWYFASPTRRKRLTFSSISTNRRICWRKAGRR